MTVYSNSQSDRALVLLGTYNGERHLKEQIKSLQAQTYHNWELIIRDDNSNDNTLEIINHFVHNDGRISLLNDTKGHLGAAGNFSELMMAALKKEASVVFFCDQDDVWLRDKIQIHLCEIKKNQGRLGESCPILIHSDMIVADNHLNPIRQSYLSYYKRIKTASKVPLPLLLPGNYIPGCSSALNRALLRLASPIPAEVPIHDWWVALCAAACGHVQFINKSLVLYRQHEKNKIGTKIINHTAGPFHKRLKKRILNIHKNFILSVRQAGKLKERIQGKEISASSDLLRCINVYANCLKMGFPERLRAIRRNNIRRPSTLHSMVFYLLLSFADDSIIPRKESTVFIKKG